MAWCRSGSGAWCGAWSGETPIMPTGHGNSVAATGLQHGRQAATGAKKDKDAGVTFAEHQGYSDRFPIVWTLILNGAAEHAGLQVRAPPHEPRSADVTRAEP